MKTISPKGNLLCISNLRSGRHDEMMRIFSRQRNQQLEQLPPKKQPPLLQQQASSAIKKRRSPTAYNDDGDMEDDDDEINSHVTNNTNNNNTNSNQITPPKCIHCGKVYSNPSNLRQHVRNVHVSIDKSLWHLCLICGKKLKTKHYLINHQLQAHGVHQRINETLINNKGGRGGLPNNNNSNSNNNTSTCNNNNGDGNENDRNNFINNDMIMDDNEIEENGDNEDGTEEEN